MTGFVFKDGRAYVVQRGQATPLDREVTLRVTPDQIYGFDQIPRKLTPGMMLTIDGRLVTAPVGLVFAPAAKPQPIAERDSWMLDRGVYGQNLSGLAPARASTAPKSEKVVKVTGSKRQNIPSTTKSVTTKAKTTPGVVTVPVVPVVAEGRTSSILESQLGVAAGASSGDSGAYADSIGASANYTGLLPPVTLEARAATKDDDLLPLPRFETSAGDPALKIAEPKIDKNLNLAPVSGAATAPALEIGRPDSVITPAAGALTSPLTPEGPAMKQPQSAEAAAPGMLPPPVNLSPGAKSGTGPVPTDAAR